MSTTQTTNTKLAKPDVGTEDNSWGGLLNAIFDAIDALFAKRTTVSVAAADVTLTATQYRCSVIEATGSPGTARNIVLPAIARVWTVFNNVGDSSVVTFKTSGGSGVAVPAGQRAQVYSDGADIVAAVSTKSRAGVVEAYAGSTEPDGALFCYGQAISRTTYAALFSAIGTTYGNGNGSTTFNVPDIRGRVIAGHDDMGGVSADRLTIAGNGSLNGDVLGATGGSENHTLTSAEMPSHSHGAGTLATASAGNHTHSYETFATSSSVQSGTLEDGLRGGQIRNTGSNGAHTHTITGSTASAGSGSAHNNVQPTIILNYIIWTE